MTTNRHPDSMRVLAQAVAERRDDCDMVQKAPSEDSFYAPDETRKKRALKPFPYGIGIDCHRSFIQVCLRTSMAA